MDAKRRIGDGSMERTKAPIWSACIITAAVLLGRSDADAQPAAVERLATFPNGTFLENMLAEADGSVLYTSYFARQVRRWTPSGGMQAPLAIDAFPVSLARTADGRLVVVAHTTTFDK
jgi:hypothetical protein